MLTQNMISQAEYDDANASQMTASRRFRNIEVPAPYVAEMVRQTIYEEFGEETYTRGFEVTTSIDGDLQLAANSAIVNGLETFYDKRHGYRGPTAHYPPDPVDPEESWLNELEPIPSYGNQLPAIVTNIAGRSFTALLKSGEYIQVPWDGMDWAYTFITRNNAWPPPQTASDVVSIGDFIRVKLCCRERILNIVNRDPVERLGAFTDQPLIMAIKKNSGDITGWIGEKRINTPAADFHDPLLPSFASKNRNSRWYVFSARLAARRSRAFALASSEPKRDVTAPMEADVMIEKFITSRPSFWS